MNKQETVELKILIEGRLANGSTGAAIAEAIDAKYLRIDRAELPDVVDDPAGKYFTAGDWRYPIHASPDSNRRMAYEQLAAAEHLEQRDTEEVKREERRRDIYVSLGGYRDSWQNIDAMFVSNAIDRIIELTDGTP